MPDAADLMARIHEAFSSDADRPTRFTVPNSSEWPDDEIDRAESLFASRTPETLVSTDVGIGAGWPEVFLTQPGLHYFMPGFGRLVLEMDNESTVGFTMEDFLSILSPERIRELNPRQKESIADLLDFIRTGRNVRISDVVDRRLKRLRA